MASSFSRTLRSIRADRPARHVLAIGVALLLVAAWLSWATLARVAVYEATPAARLEVQQASHPVQAPVAGRVVTIAMPLGSEVKVGDVLCELDGDAQRLELGQAKARLNALEPELAAARNELAAHGQASVDDGQGVDATVAEARAKLDQAKVAETLAREQAARAERMRKEGLTSEAEIEKARSEVAQKNAATQAAQMAVNRSGASGRADLSDRRARREGVARSIAVLEGEKLTTKALIERLEHQVALRVVRATVSGRLAEVAAVTVGSVVREGDRLGAIVPAGELRIIAEFPPSRSLGRIQVGQRARLRLDGFPWAQHGTIPATVSHAASEVRDGRVRVELAVLPNDSSVPLQHGLPGTLEVEVERVAPLALVLRAAGKLVDGSRSEDTASGAPPGSPP
jgi:multidrug resistance efflux pump